MRQITLDGRIGKDGAKVYKTAKGKDYIRFSLANDSFVNGANKTEWFDITCFDPYIVENRLKYLTQGRYAIVQGVYNGEVTQKNGHTYLNHYVNATTIETPSFGGKRDDSESQVSTYTGGTKPDTAIQVETKPEPAPMVTEETPHVSVSQASPAGWSDGDDLPF